MKYNFTRSIYKSINKLSLIYEITEQTASTSIYRGAVASQSYTIALYGLRRANCRSIDPLSATTLFKMRLYSHSRKYTRIVVSARNENGRTESRCLDMRRHRKKNKSSRALKRPHTRSVCSICISWDVRLSFVPVLCEGKSRTKCVMSIFRSKRICTRVCVSGFFYIESLMKTKLYGCSSFMCQTIYIWRQLKEVSR